MEKRIDSSSEGDHALKEPGATGPGVKQNKEWDVWNLEKLYVGNSLSVQRLRLHASTAGGPGSIPGQGTKILHATQRDQTDKQKNPPNP